MISDAETRAKTTVAKAQDEADRIVDNVQRDADDHLARAQSEAQRMIDSDNEQYQAAFSSLPWAACKRPR